MKPLLTRSKKEARLEIVPLIDVIFFLLATFILVSLSMTKQPGVRVALPETMTSQPHELAENVTITISPQGALYWNDDMIGYDRFLIELMKYRETCRQEGREGRILLNADRKAPYGKVAVILDEVRKSGIRKVTIESQAKTSA